MLIVTQYALCRTVDEDNKPTVPGVHLQWPNLELHLPDDWHSASSQPPLSNLLHSFTSNSPKERDGDLTLSSLCFPAFCWNIWQERNFRAFMQNDTTWEITLKGILDQVRTNAIFLNLDISPPLCASWNLPQPSLPQSTHLITLKQNEPCWNELIVLRDHESVGAFRESTGQLKWIFH